MTTGTVDTTITTYRNAGHVRWAMDAYGPGVDEGCGRYERLNEDGRVQEITINDDVIAEPHDGDWYYVLNDRHVGPFESREAAIDHAKNELENFSSRIGCGCVVDVVDGWAR